MSNRATSFSIISQTNATRASIGELSIQTLSSSFIPSQIIHMI